MKTEWENVAIIGGTFEDENKDSNLGYNEYDKESREWLMNQLLPDGKGKKILDLGCSIGAWGAFFKSKGYKEIYGVDISKERLKTAAKRGYKTFHAHGTKLPFKNGFFDVVVCIDVLVHTIQKKDRYKTIKEAQRVLKPGGTFVYSIANKKFEDLSNKLNFYLPKEKRGCGNKSDYCRFIYSSEALDAAEKAGLKVVETRGLQFVYPSVVVKLPALLRVFDKAFSRSFLKKYARVIFVKAVKK